MKALSIKQPWAWAIMAGHKAIENRTWHSNYKGFAVIHAGKQFDRDAGEEGWGLDLPESFSTGALLGIAMMTGCIHEPPKVGAQWYQGPHGFTLAYPRWFPEPVPYRGQLGFFEIDDMIIAQAWEA